MVVKRPLFTENFSSNLSGIQEFLGADGAAYFAKFFGQFIADVVPHACSFPLAGRSFLERSIQTTQSQTLASKLKQKLDEGEDIRELIVDDYLVLYLVRGADIVFLSIKHHRQLSYDLKTFWRE